MVGGNVASLQHCVELYPRKRRLLHTIGFMPVPYRPVRPLDRPPPPRLTPPHHPLPQCLLLKVTQSKLGQSSQVKQKRRGPIAVETGLCSVCLLCLIPLSLRISPTSTFVCSSPPSPQLSSILSTQGESCSPTTQLSSEGQGREGMIER